MVMDLLRSCYETDLQQSDNPADVVRVRWFFTDKDAKIFPGRHIFGSNNWGIDYANQDGPGEIVNADRPWANGSRPPFDGSIGAGFTGKSFAGRLEDFQEGTNSSSPPVGGNSVGLCQSCAPIPPPPPSCDDLYNALPDTVYLRILNKYGVSGTHTSNWPVNTRIAMTKLPPHSGAFYLCYLGGPSGSPWVSPQKVMGCFDGLLHLQQITGGDRMDATFQMELPIIGYWKGFPAFIGTGPPPDDSEFWDVFVEL